MLNMDTTSYLRDAPCFLHSYECNVPKLDITFRTII